MKDRLDTTKRKHGESSALTDNFVTIIYIIRAKAAWSYGIESEDLLTYASFIFANSEASIV